LLSRSGAGHISKKGHISMQKPTWYDMQLTNKLYS